jgi:long-chain acyl-CoA synthetase
MNNRTHISHAEQDRFNALYATLSSSGKLLYAGTLLARAAQLYPAHTALLYEDESISYKELYARASSLSRLLRLRGVNPRDRVLICIENTPFFYIAYYAIWQIGAIVVPLNTFLKEAELAHIIRDAEPSLIITHKERLSMFGATQIALPPLLTESDLSSDGEPLQDHELTQLDDHEMAALLYTSGTTGLPKGVMLSSKNIMTNLVQGAARLDVPEHGRVFGVLPLFHSFAQNACVWGSIFKGYTVILVHKIERRLIIKNLEKYKPTIFLGVPALYGLLCLLRKVPLESVELFVSGGDALPDRIRSVFSLLFRRKICCGYGLTETTPLVSFEIDDEFVVTNNVGAPVIGISLSIRDEQGNEVAPGTIGELWVKGDNIMLGYYKAPQATEQVMKDGWFNTGDLVYCDEKGRIVISGRTKDLISNKGLKIYPQEVENVISSHSNVLRVGVIGKIDPASGEIPIAYIQLRKEQQNIEKELENLCKMHLAVYKIPREFICSVTELATTATGKVDKKVLRKLIK